MAHSVNYVAVDGVTNVVTSLWPGDEAPAVNFVTFLFERLQRKEREDVLVDVPTGRSWTGGQLQEAIRRVAHVLVFDLHLRTGHIVTFYCPSSDFHAILQLAVIAAGAVYTGCFHNYPLRELSNVLSQTNPVYLVASQDTLPVALQAANGVSSIKKILVIDAEGDTRLFENEKIIPFRNMFFRNRSTSVTIPIKLDAMREMGAIFFSSGSTGDPKMVIRTHSNLVAQSLDSVHPRVSFCGPTDVTACHQPLCHMSGLLCLGIFIAAGTKVLISPLFEPEKYITVVDKYKATVGLLFPSHLILLARSPRLSPRGLKSMRQVVTAGAPLLDNVIDEIKDKLKIEMITQRYASTETGTIMMTPRNLCDPRTIGTIVPGFKVKVVDPSTGLVLGPNLVGEIYVKGPQVTPGYYMNPGATEASFTEDGFYRTGDACYFDDKGLFYFVDRYKDLIKVNSQQVPPKELEALLLQHQAVAEAAVVGIPDDLHGQVPKAYVVLKPEDEGTTAPSSLIDWVNDQVGDSKRLRGGLEFLPQLPKLGVGKIDKNRLKGYPTNN